MERFLQYLIMMLVSCLLLSCSESDSPEETILVKSIQVFGSDIADGSELQCTVLVLPSTVINKVVTWSVSNTDVATISDDGLLTPLTNGTVTVKASATDGSGVVGAKEIKITGVGSELPPPTTEPPTIDPGGIVVTSVNELTTALNAADPGDVIYIRGGNYVIYSKITIARSGNNSNKISLLAYPGDPRPKFDFSEMAESSSNQGMVLQGNYWHIKGIDFYKAGDNGLQIRGGSNNIIEFCTFSECADTGLQIDNGAANNLILNCDSYFNADSSIENADGFACKLNAGTGNKFVGCRAWQNLDDGWDGYLRDTDNITTTYENCWAYKNGYLKSGAVSGGDGNGFKTGGSDDKLLKHNGIYKNCIAAGNLVDGFDHNSNRGNITLYNCVAHGNGTNMGFGNTNPVGSLIIKNCAVPGALGNVNGAVVDITNNSWQNGLICNDLDYVSVDMTLLLAPRQSDGSLPDIGYLHLVSGSDLINKGIDVGLPYKSTAPDLGAFESDF